LSSNSREFHKLKENFDKKQLFAPEISKTLAKIRLEF